MGLALGFLLTGTSSVWGAMWSLEFDSTNPLFERAYYELAQEINKGKPDKAAALRRAQRYLQDNPDFNHPFYWAGVQHVGV